MGVAILLENQALLLGSNNSIFSLLKTQRFICLRYLKSLKMTNSNADLVLKFRFIFNNALFVWAKFFNASTRNETLFKAEARNGFFNQGRIQFIVRIF